MNVCILGDGLTSLSLAKSLVNKKINVHIYQKNKKKKLSPSRTIGISKNNLEFFNNKILNIGKKNIWAIKKIEIYSEKLNNEKILNFGNNQKDLFFMVKNDNFYKSLNNHLSKNKFYKKKIIKNDNFYQKLLKNNNYDLIINCDSKNPITKKFFIKSINKNYNNTACTTIIEHKKLENNIAVQIFTKYGPIAFLPISTTKTSIVFSIDTNYNKYDEKKVLFLIKKYNPKFKIKKILELNFFELNLYNLRNYHYKNIIAFGDSLHKIHPLAGQGFNMTIRDIKILSNIIQNKIELGMQFDSSIFDEFEKKTKHINFIFSNGIDFIYEFFNFNKKIKDKSLDKFLKFLDKNKKLKNTFIKFADKGLNI